MDILMLPFEEPLILKVNEHHIKIVTFRTPEHGNIKFGIDAPRSVKVNREEVYLAEQEKSKA
jgi:carbon storage regulator